MDRQETKNLVKYVKNCQVNELDLTDCQLALGECTRGRGIQFWQEPTFVIGGYVVTIGVTAGIICLTHAFGACQ